MKFDLELKRQHDFCKEQVIRVVGSFDDSTDEGQYSYEVDVRRASVVRGGRERNVPFVVLKSMRAELSEQVYEVIKNGGCL